MRAFATSSMQPVSGTPEYLAEQIRCETIRWGEVHSARPT
jgi:hypothetical protein